LNILPYLIYISNKKKTSPKPQEKIPLVDTDIKFEMPKPVLKRQKVHIPLDLEEPKKKSKKDEELKSASKPKRPPGRPKTESTKMKTAIRAAISKLDEGKLRRILEIINETSAQDTISESEPASESDE